MMTRMVDPVTWSDVVARFDAARNAWFGTVDAAGAPHSVPIWTASVDEVLYVFGERRSVKFRNLAANPQVVVNLESGDEVVIVRGNAYDVGTPAQVPAVVAAFAAKYIEPDDVQWLPEGRPQRRPGGTHRTLRRPALEQRRLLRHQTPLAGDVTRIVAGQAGGRRLAVPPSGTRPTSDRAREALFSSLDVSAARPDRRPVPRSLCRLGRGGAGGVVAGGGSRGSGRIVRRPR